MIAINKFQLNTGGWDTDVWIDDKTLNVTIHRMYNKTGFVQRVNLEISSNFFGCPLIRVKYKASGVNGAENTKMLYCNFDHRIYRIKKKNKLILWYL